MTGQALINAAELGTAGHAYIRCRDLKWANPNAYLRLSVLANGAERNLGPWAHLFDRETQEAIGERTPQAVLTLMPPFNLAAFLSQDYDIWLGQHDRAELVQP